MPPILIKKYGNRRLYDTDASRYVTLEEVADSIRGGAEIRVLDAKTSEDLTQSTLTQIIMESRGAAKLLPIGLLLELIRMGDDGLAEFFGRYMTLALELYRQAKRSAEAVAVYNPLATLPFSAAGAIARLASGLNPFGFWDLPSGAGMGTVDAASARSAVAAQQPGAAHHPPQAEAAPGTSTPSPSSTSTATIEPGGAGRAPAGGEAGAVPGAGPSSSRKRAAKGAAAEPGDALAQLRRELESLKKSLRKKRR